MALTAGSRLGPYEIISLLGAGGMGEVYRAQDTRLHRTVAIKVVSSHINTDPEFRNRFDREARAIAALNHPHICTLYDVGHQNGIDFLVMEYLEGETLAARLTKGALPLDQALTVAIEIADALDKAHRAGIVHRDLKPGNLMLTKAGAKLLDFGLARLPGVRPPIAELTSLPTAASSLTREHTILGTAPYMAPEQFEGRPADGRTDIFAFGAVVYEMLVARKAFQGESHASVMAVVLQRNPPPVSSLRADIPPALSRVIAQCVAKAPDDRWQSARDVVLELEWIRSTPLTNVADSSIAYFSTRRISETSLCLVWALVFRH
jgi:serine/threonine protein kinase